MVAFIEFFSAINQRTKTVELFEKHFPSCNNTQNNEEKKNQQKQHQHQVL